MPDLAKIAQSRPSAATLTDLYIVPINTLFAGKLTMLNETTASILIRVSIADGGAANTASQYIVGGNVTGYSLGGDGIPEEISGITLGAADVIRVYSTTAGCVFTLNGIERNP